MQFSTKQTILILSVFYPPEIKNISGEVLWTQPSPNAPKLQRPIMLQTGKESSESLQSFQVFNGDITKAELEGFVATLHANQVINVKSKIASYTLDRKADNLLLGLGGVYCVLSSLQRRLP